MVSKKMIVFLALFASLCVFALMQTAYSSGHLCPCHIETRDGYYASEDAFNPDEDVYVNGSGFPCDVWVDIHVVKDTTWSDGMDIPQDGMVTTVKTSSIGEIPPTMVWSSPLTPGKYDIIVDVNRDCKYDNCDCLLDNHINVTAGFLVIPEYIIGTALAVAGCFGAFGVYRLFKPKNRINAPL